MNQFCSNCGTALGASASFCGECGMPVVALPQQPPGYAQPQQQSPGYGQAQPQQPGHPEQQPQGYGQPQQQPQGYGQPQQQSHGYAHPQQQPHGYAQPEQRSHGYDQPPAGYGPPQQQPPGHAQYPPGHSPQQPLPDYAGGEPQQPIPNADSPYGVSPLVSSPSNQTEQRAYAPPQAAPLAGAPLGAPAPYYDERSPSPGYGAQPSPGYGAQPPPGYGAQPSPGYGAQPSPGYGAQPSPGYGAQPSPGYAQPAEYGAQSLAAASGAAVPPSGVAALAGPMPKAAVRPSGGTATKVLGGCGIAGCLGVVFVAIVGIALVSLFLIGRSHAARASNVREPTAGTAVGSEIPSHGGLKELVRDQIGPYKLTEAGRPEKLPAVLNPDLIDSLGLMYSGNGAKISHMLCAYPSSATAESRLDAVLRGSPTVALRTAEGKQYGRAGVVRDEDSQLVAWTNGPGLFIALGSPPHALEFSQKTPY